MRQREGEAPLVEFTGRADATKALIHGKKMADSTLNMQWGPPNMPE